jgi:hypothetical protein
MTLKMNRAADRLTELSGPTYITRQNYNRITNVVPVPVFSYPVAVVAPALARAQVRVLAREQAAAPQVLALAL